MAVCPECHEPTRNKSITTTLSRCPPCQKAYKKRTNAEYWRNSHPQEVKTLCRYCGKKEVVKDNGFNICQSCGRSDE